MALSLERWVDIEVNRQRAVKAIEIGKVLANDYSRLSIFDTPIWKKREAARASCACRTKQCTCRCMVYCNRDCSCFRKCDIADAKASCTRCPLSKCSCPHAELDSQIDTAEHTYTVAKKAYDAWCAGGWKAAAVDRDACTQKVLDEVAADKAARANGVLSAWMERPAVEGDTSRPPWAVYAEIAAGTCPRQTLFPTHLSIRFSPHWDVQNTLFAMSAARVFADAVPDYVPDSPPSEDELYVVCNKLIPDASFNNATILEESPLCRALRHIAATVPAAATAGAIPTSALLRAVGCGSRAVACEFIRLTRGRKYDVENLWSLFSAIGYHNPKNGTAKSYARTAAQFKALFKNALATANPVAKAPPRRTNHPVWGSDSLVAWDTVFGASVQSVPCLCCATSQLLRTGPDGKSHSGWQRCHVVAHAAGGETTLANLMIACSNCNKLHRTKNALNVMASMDELRPQVIPYLQHMATVLQWSGTLLELASTHYSPATLPLSADVITLLQPRHSSGVPASAAFPEHNELIRQQATHISELQAQVSELQEKATHISELQAQVSELQEKATRIDQLLSELQEQSHGHHTRLGILSDAGMFLASTAETLPNPYITHALLRDFGLRNSACSPPLPDSHNLAPPSPHPPFPASDTNDSSSSPVSRKRQAEGTPGNDAKRIRRS